MNPVIELRGLTKSYGNGKGIFDVSFSVGKGEVFGYLGPNGAGKTTTIRQLMGFVRSDSGICRILGKDCFSSASEIQKETGYLAGELTFMEDMTGIGFLNFMAEMKGMKNKSRRNELMERFELNPHGKICKMSKGMKQKVGIVNAFMHQPKVVILDEPTSGLDPLMQNRFVELILEEKRKGTTILMSSHIFEEIEKTCDRTAIIREGRIAALPDMKELAQKRRKIYTVTLKDRETAERLRKEPGLELWKNPSNGLKTVENQVELVVSANIGETLQKIAAYEPLDLNIKTQSLEELFMHYYGKEEEK